MTLEEAAKYLQIGVETAYRLSRKRRLPTFRVGGRWRANKEVLDSWVLKGISKRT